MGNSLWLWFQSLRPLEAFIQEACEGLSLLEICDIADPVCFQPILQHDFAVVLQLLDLVLLHSFVHPNFFMRKHSEGDLIRENGKPSGGSSRKDDLILQEGHFGFLSILVVKVVEAIAGRPENQPHVDDTGQFTSNVGNHFMSEPRQHDSAEEAEHGNNPEKILIEKIPAEPFHGVAVTVFVEFRPVRNSVFCFVEILHEFLSDFRVSICDPLFPRTARAYRGKPVVRSSAERMAG